MQIHLVAFASAAQAVGGAEQELEIPAGSSVGDLRALLVERFPSLGPLMGQLAIGVDDEICGDDPVLVEGCEVALLPPVSGGTPTETLASSWLTDAPIAISEVLALVRHPGAGAIVTFVGTARASSAGEAVRELDYSAYRPLADRALERIVESITKGTPGLRLAIHHRLGRVAVGEVSVVIAASSAHREPAFRASRLALERIKSQVPIWKRELLAGGASRWPSGEPLRPNS